MATFGGQRWRPCRLASHYENASKRGFIRVKLDLKQIDVPSKFLSQSLVAYALGAHVVPLAFNHYMASHSAIQTISGNATSSVRQSLSYRNCALIRLPKI